MVYWWVSLFGKEKIVQALNAEAAAKKAFGFYCMCMCIAGPYLIKPRS